MFYTGVTQKFRSVRLPSGSGPLVLDQEKDQDKGNALDFWQRWPLLWLTLSVAATWIFAHEVAPPGHAYKALSPLGQHLPPASLYGLDSTKLALIFEPRPVGHLAAKVVQTVATLPLSWHVLYIGTNESIARLDTSHAVKMAKERGRLTLETAPDWLDIDGPSNISMSLGSEDFYDALPSSVEWLFVSGSDSALCANSETTMNDWLNYDWVGSPWQGNHWSEVWSEGWNSSLPNGGNVTDSWSDYGNNGFSLRRISAVKGALRSLRRSEDPIDDTMLMNAIRVRSSAFASDAQASAFVVEGIWKDRPMAFHPPRGPYEDFDRWDDAIFRNAIYEYCPELKVVLDMKTTWERCPGNETNGTALGRPA